MMLDKAQVHTNLGSTYLELYRTESQCSKPPNSPDELLNKAQENYLEGIKIHEELQKKLGDTLEDYNNIKLGDLYNNIANVYFQKSEKAKAKSHYQKSFNLRKKCGDVRGTKRILRDYLSFLKEDNSKPGNLEAMRTESEVLEFVFAEKPISSTHLLYYKKKLASNSR